MIYKKFQIKIFFIYQDIHIYLKYFNLFHKNDKICELESTIKKSAIIYEYILRYIDGFMMNDEQN